MKMIIIIIIIMVRLRLFSITMSNIGIPVKVRRVCGRHSTGVAVEQQRQSTYNVTMNSVRVTIVAVEKQ